MSRPYLTKKPLCGIIVVGHLKKKQTPVYFDNGSYYTTIKETPMKEFDPRKLKNVRLFAGYKHIKQAANVANVDESHLGDLEKGKAVPSLETLRKLAAAYAMELNITMTRRTTGKNELHLHEYDMLHDEGNQNEE